MGASIWSLASRNFPPSVGVWKCAFELISLLRGLVCCVDKFVTWISLLRGLVCYVDKFVTWISLLRGLVCYVD